MTQKFKVKIMRSAQVIDTYDDYYTRSVFYPVSGDWDEVDEQERVKLFEAIAYANSQPGNRDKGQYFLVEYSDDFKEEVFADAHDFLEKQRKAQERDEKRKAEEKARRDAKAQERKRKQLEKLKRELGEE
jgi:hypothetical protein